MVSTEDIMKKYGREILFLEATGNRQQATGFILQKTMGFAASFLVEVCLNEESICYDKY